MSAVMEKGSIKGGVEVCALDDILPDMGVCALVEGRQVAVFRVGETDEVYAIGNYDANSGAAVLSRGIVGDLGGRLVVASPIYKQHYDLKTGECIEDPIASVRVYSASVKDGRVFVAAPPMSVRGKASQRPRLVVIGNGMAAMRVVEELLRIAPELYDITVFGAEPHGNYNRILLSPVLSGEKRVEEIMLNTREWYARHGIVLHTGDPIVSIDRPRRTVRAQSGYETTYDRLLLATGSNPFIIPVPGKDLKGVVSFRDLQDVDAMLQASKHGKHAVVIGGGLLGLEAANGLMRQGMQVTVVHLMDSLMERQLDKNAGAMLKASLESRGLKFVMPAQTEEILGHDRVTGVRFKDDSVIPADLVVMAVGIKPNTALAQSCGLRCERGVIVDDTLQTYDPRIYAVGECVQHRNATYGLVAPLWEQANVCATHLAQMGFARYQGSLTSTKLKVTGIDLFSAGDFIGGEGTEDLVMRDPKRGVYKRLVLKDNRIKGAVLFGDVTDGPWYFELMQKNQDITAIRQKLLFGKAFCEPS
ncbi:MAG: nitrite reductase small subunit NirD [Nevskiaceae bacterium]|nr:MAG: nitrite reductase small subunit NirD [Nevskiaceae bacterium]